MEDNLQSLNNIGPYIAERFVTHSRWNGADVPIQNLQQLKNFIIRRANNIDENEAKEKISQWLKVITKNQRNSQCLNNQKYRKVIEGVERNYKVREFNFYAFNAIIDYWVSVIPVNLVYAGKNIKQKIPRRITQVGITHKYPLQCTV